MVVVTSTKKSSASLRNHCNFGSGPCRWQGCRDANPSLPLCMESMLEKGCYATTLRLHNMWEVGTSSVRWNQGEDAQLHAESRMGIELHCSPGWKHRRSKESPSSCRTQWNEWRWWVAKAWIWRGYHECCNRWIQPSIYPFHGLAATRHLWVELQHDEDAWRGLRQKRASQAEESDDDMQVETNSERARG